MKLTSLSVDKLLGLQTQIQSELKARQSKLEKELATLGRSNGRSKRNGSHLKGVKIKPKYKGPKGETWAGRGQKPKWLVALVKAGRKMESYRVKA